MFCYNDRARFFVLIKEYNSHIPELILIPVILARVTAGFNIFHLHAEEDIRYAL
jgi:hypothetical protein